jgi:glycerol-3-phosphate dehydrogenase
VPALATECTQRYDVAIIGAGVIGTLVARELSRYALRVALLERHNDVAQGTTKANSAIVHAGFDAKPGSRKAKMNVAGNRKMPELCQTLHVPFHRNGSLVVAFTPEEMPELEALLARGQANGVPELRLLSPAELHALEPNVNPDAVGALYAPTGGIISPFELAIAAAECALRNGVELYRNFAVEQITQTAEGFLLASPNGQLAASLVVNAAGVHSDDVARMIGDDSFRILPRRGEYLLLDSARGGVVTATIFQCPSKMGKGVLITPTVHGNVLIGPSAEDIDEKDDLSTTDPGLRGIQEAVHKSVPGFAIRDVITSFTGIRAHCDQDEFILGASQVNPRMIHAAGIESPGLSAAPAIAEYIAALVYNAADAPGSKGNWIPGRPEPVRLREMTTEQRRAAIAQNPAYGRIVCRCETVSEGEILEAIHAPAGARDVDGVKRRTRAGMGRCQGGFCGTKVLEILARELDAPPESITKSGGESAILLEKTK